MYLAWATCRNLLFFEYVDFRTASARFSSRTLHPALKIHHTSKMIVEVRIIQLRPDVGVENPALSAHDVIHSFCAHALTREGARYAYFGRSSEQANTMFIIVGWETLENSNKFASPP